MADGVKSDEAIEGEYGTCIMAIEIENNIVIVGELSP